MSSRGFCCVITYSVTLFFRFLFLPLFILLTGYHNSLAAQLPFLHLLHNYFNVLVHVCVYILIDQSSSEKGRPLAFYVTRHYISHSGCLLLYSCLVCWWAYGLPLLFDVIQPGDITLTTIYTYF